MYTASFWGDEKHVASEMINNRCAISPKKPVDSSAELPAAKILTAAPEVNKGYCETPFGH